MTYNRNANFLKNAMYDLLKNHAKHLDFTRSPNLHSLITQLVVKQLISLEDERD